ncbi:hypothetical protein GCM10011362_09510 [Marinobacter halophilus]|uniref:DUF2057 domain-containing protein n=1 Tax=Marinobacter halophilus TaxID=1323740 RepID=A0A2T1KFR9_9GAMM|nr:DUF2057 domain-containing protein [Marinobacter halophilus]GGC63209.1 hypothetical protein GCM10011362_09510 [Marinobacter halophilus]
MPVSAVAGTELNLGACVSVQAVNGSEQRASSGQSLKLDDGTQQLVVECTAEIGREAILEASNAFVLVFTEESTELTLSAPEIRSRRDMDAFNRQGNWTLVDGKGRPVDFTSDILEKEGFQLVRDYPRELEAYNRSGAVAAVTARAETVGTELTSNQEGLLLDSQADPDQEMVSRMLRYWYLKADEKTRKEWDSWIDSSER